ncbi:MAG: DNA-binding protein [Curvibacter sp.]|nr:MAG: DNA-binding protein [Curvibacter sp.]
MDFNPTAPYQTSSEATNAETRGADLEPQSQELGEPQERQEKVEQGQPSTSQKKPRPTRQDKVYRPLIEVRHEFLTTDELAYYLRLKEQTIRKKRMNGTLGIDPVKIGGRLRWPRQFVINYLSKLFSHPA